MNNKINFPSIFDSAVDSEKEFDTIFGGEEDCDLIDVVCGESGDADLPDDSELHQTDDNAGYKDIADELGEGHDTKNKPTCDSSSAPALNDKEGNNISDSKYGVQDSPAGDATKTDEESIEDETDKATVRFKEAYISLMREAAEDLDEEFDENDLDNEVEGKKMSGDPSSDDDNDEDLVSEFNKCEEPVGDPPSDEEPVEEAGNSAPSMSEDAEEENLIDAVEDEDKTEDASVEELESKLDDDTDEDLIDIVAGE